MDDKQISRRAYKRLKNDGRPGILADYGRSLFQGTLRRNTQLKDAT